MCIRDSRDNRWDRVEKAYKVLTTGEGEAAESAVAAMEASYAKDVTDEDVYKRQA